MAADERTAPVRLGALPTLPVFFKLRGRRTVIAGGGEPAVWKAEVLRAAGAHVEVIGAEICPEMEALATELGPDGLRVIRRPWQETDLEGAALALGAIEDDGEAERFRAAAARAGVPVNVIDKPVFCDFQFGTLVSRGPLVLAITTDGAAPVFGQTIRARLEAWLPDGLTAWAQAAKDWRPMVQERAWDFHRRRRFWEAFADRALASAHRAPDIADRDACLAAVEGTPAAAAGSIVLVGSGPGTPESLTFAAARALQTAEVLLYETGLPEALVTLARREAVKHAVASDDEAVAAATTATQAGRRVVWLGTGNPAACRRWRRRIDRISPFAPLSTVDGLGACPTCAGRWCDREDAPPPSLPA